MTMKVVAVEYVESGTFQGGEEDVFAAEIEYGETCAVMSQKSYDELRVELDRLYAIEAKLIENSLKEIS